MRANEARECLIAEQRGNYDDRCNSRGKPLLSMISGAPARVNPLGVTGTFGTIPPTALVLSAQLFQRADQAANHLPGVPKAETDAEK